MVTHYSLSDSRSKEVVLSRYPDRSWLLAVFSKQSENSEFWFWRIYL